MEGSPVNYSDPTGRYSAIQIAKSYGITVQELVDALKEGKNIPALKNKWGWIKMLLDAHNGQSIQIGSDALFLPFLTMYPKETIGLNGDKITIGGSGILSYTYQYLDNQIAPVLWWRNTKPSHYLLNSVEYFDNHRDLPAFRTLSADALFLFTLASANPLLGLVSQLLDIGGAITIDAYGNVYGTVFGSVAPGLGSGIVVGEGYINANPMGHLSSILGNGPIPSEQEIHNTLTKLCINGGGNALTGTLQGSVCGGGSAAFMYGYTAGIYGASIGPSWTFEPRAKIPSLAWYYINNAQGVSSNDVLNRITLDLLLYCQ